MPSRPPCSRKRAYGSKASSSSACPPSRSGVSAAASAPEITLRAYSGAEDATEAVEQEVGQGRLGRGHDRLDELVDAVSLRDAPDRARCERACVIALPSGVAEDHDAGLGA